LNLEYAVTDNLFTSAIGYIAIYNCKAGPFNLYNRSNQICKGVRYHITNEALIGACLLPAGAGSMSSSISFIVVDANLLRL
jgi:hypothetical protein